ncbi:MAG: hypothetical protein ACR2PX_04605 [Endozoicomonas sp.]|uniref:hypothetical protein n=1 Tax=Endozoicomonas sp. TaxID=1892382 RepID=UPI003D9AF1DA
MTETGNDKITRDDEDKTSIEEVRAKAKKDFEKTRKLSLDEPEVLVSGDMKKATSGDDDEKE